MNPRFFAVLALLPAAAAQAQPLNAETLSHYGRQTAAVQPQLPQKISGFFTVKAVSFHNGTVYTLYEIPDAVLQEQPQQAARAISRIQAETRRQYYREVCTVGPPLQKISRSHWLQTGSGRLAARWEHTPEMCGSGEIRQIPAQEVLPEGRMVRSNVRLDGSSFENGGITVRYTLTDRDFDNIATMLPYAVNTMKAKVAAGVCRPEGGMKPGIEAVRFIVRDKNGKALPPVDITPVDCMAQPETAPPPQEGKPRRKANG